jgi:hypothetical protein
MVSSLRTNGVVMDIITQGSMHEYATSRKPFTTSTETVFTKDNDDLYVVYSYGEHFPMYVYDKFVELWFANYDKYSPTTSKHQTLARPDVDEINMLSTEELSMLIRLGGYRDFCSDRCVTNMAMYYPKSTGYTNFNQRRA